MATTVLIAPTRVIFGGGKFDSQRRYLRAGNAAAQLPITQGVTFQISRDALGQTTNWRYSVAGYVVNSGSLTGNSSFSLVTV